MATTFLAGVANARIFKGNNLFATAKTLVDSSITIGVSAEDIRAGKGAKLYGKYFHTSTFDLKMTDAMFKLEYIAANVGSDIELGGDVFADEAITTGASGSVTFQQTAKALVAGSSDIYAYVREANSDKWYTFAVTTNGITVGDTAVNDSTYALKASTDYCVQYVVTNDNAKKLVVKANFTPDTLSVYLDADLFSGDDKNPSTGTKIGTVTIKVPRFLLSGSQELAMNMTGASQTPFEGSALASNASGCDGEGIYAEIIEVIDGDNWTGQVKEILIGSMNNLVGGDPISVYVHVDNKIKQLNLTYATSTTSAFHPYVITCTKGGVAYDISGANPQFAAATDSPVTYVFTYQGKKWNKEHTAIVDDGAAVTQTVIIPANA